MMRVAVTGGNGAVGRAIIATTPASDYELVAAVRSERAAADLRALGANVRIERVSYDEPATLVAAFTGASAVIHLPGILVERPGATYEAANVDTTRRVAEAAKSGGVAKLVFVSAIGADTRSPNRYWRTKGEAEAIVRASGIAWTILRVPMLLGTGTEAATALRRRLQRRTIVLLDGGRTRHQPLDVTDVARAVIAACDPAVARDATLDLVGPSTLPEREIVERAARLLGRQVRIVSAPTAAVRLAVRVLRRVTGRGFSPEALEVLTTDTSVDATPAVRALGIELTPLDRTLRASLAP